jgi:hypothetical protein
MESLLHRYRNITVLFVAIIAQIGAIAWQVRKDDDVPLLRIWAVSAVTPVASAIENLRSGAFGVFTDYFSFSGNARSEPRAAVGTGPVAPREPTAEERTRRSATRGGSGGF